MDKVIAGGLSSPKALSLWAYLHLWSNQPREALSIFSKLLPKGTLISPSNADDFLELAQTLARTSDLDTAEDILHQLLSPPVRLPSELAKIHEELGLLSQSRSNLAAAITH